VFEAFREGGFYRPERLIDRRFGFIDRLYPEK